MPTDLPVRSRDGAAAQITGWTWMLSFYGIVGLAVMLLMAAEVRLGLFRDLTVAESIVKATQYIPLDDETTVFSATARALPLN